MNRSEAELTGLMREAVEYGIRHVESGGLPFVGVVVGDGGYVSAPGVNLVYETRDPRAHAEIVAMREALSKRDDLRGTWLLATGEPCGLCYRFAIDHGVERVYVAVDSDTAAAYGFDYRRSYPAYGVNPSRLAATGMVRRLEVPRGLEPFERFLHIGHGGAQPPSASPTKSKGTS
ncbi:deaminase [Saccharomonospora xinjiangensis]|uniref:Cytosine/adenosine deaminase n=1 Tax=Saccharomonospora xinjiangensis XJ-54 TaxID=882086 RepID=I0V4U1_9PSEU|nr:deaminase [Saccharomonospora xinjiangensis]EID55144.1 cytosine/adenosine deaminase [Saccharomonospora xinjiangensis XJ-54]